MATERVRGVGRSAFSTLGGFRQFILRGNVVDLAVGIVIGTAFTAVVNALVTYVISPLIPAPGGNLTTWQIIIPWTHKPLQIGTFINAIITFLIIAFVVYYFIVLPVTAFMNRYKPKPAPVLDTRECPYCLSIIHKKATRCPDCTSQVQPID
ncbi:MAG TPA: large conductance mechanosensitive channel protein MscL [Ktedonobacteraceae bacterium]|nr:large conductance mechanosensitive channel protein MscL [Ktedonobacteraceae bacterium]